MTPGAENESPGDLAKLQRSPSDMAAWQQAQQLLRNRLHAAAGERLSGLTQQFPGVAQLWIELSAAAAGNLDFALANQAIARAAELKSANPQLIIAIGKQLSHLGHTEAATACFTRATAADPASPGPRLTLAAWLERNGRLDEAFECVNTCLAQHPGNARAIYFKAFLSHRKGLNPEAETTLRDLLKNDSVLPMEGQASAWHLLGTVLDALGNYKEALACLEKSKALQRRAANTGAFEQAYDKLDQERRWLLSELTPETLRRWRDESPAAPCPHRLALLAGAPRSGTTLIEQILGAHPEILVFDEPPAFAKELLDNLLPPPGTAMTLQTLDSLSATVRTQSIRRYFTSLLQTDNGNPDSKLLLDKNPSTTGVLHLWLRLFPQSKTVIALRDPRDVLVSCYFQNIPVNATSVNFLSLERTARFYSDCMNVWLRLRDLGGFEWIETKYEDVVRNLEKEGQRVTNFLGLPWHPAQATYHQTAQRKFLNAPTYHEATQPVYTKAVGRWNHYAEALAPLQLTLEPYVRAFGYE